MRSVASDRQSRPERRRFGNSRVLTIVYLPFTSIHKPAIDQGTPGVIHLPRYRSCFLTTRRLGNRHEPRRERQTSWLAGVAS
jgi:hypothetical protein